MLACSSCSAAIRRSCSRSVSTSPVAGPNATPKTGHSTSRSSWKSADWPGSPAQPGLRTTRIPARLRACDALAPRHPGGAGAARVPRQRRRPLLSIDTAPAGGSPQHDPLGGTRRSPGDRSHLRPDGRGGCHLSRRRTRRKEWRCRPFRPRPSEPVGALLRQRQSGLRDQQSGRGASRRRSPRSTARFLAGDRARRRNGQRDRGTARRARAPGPAAPDRELPGQRAVLVLPSPSRTQAAASLSRRADLVRRRRHEPALPSPGHRRSEL